MIRLGSCVVNSGVRVVTSSAKSELPVAKYPSEPENAGVPLNVPTVAPEDSLTMRFITVSKSSPLARYVVPLPPALQSLFPRQITAPVASESRNHEQPAAT